MSEAATHAAPAPAGQGRPLEVLAAFARQHNPPFPILVPPPESVLSKVQVPIPQTFIYDKQGRLAQELMGQIDPPGLRATLEKLLAE